MSFLQPLLARPMTCALVAAATLVINDKNKLKGSQARRAVPELIANIAVATFVVSVTGASFSSVALLAAVPLVSRGLAHIKGGHPFNNALGYIKLTTGKFFALGRIASSVAFCAALVFQVRSAPLTLGSLTLEAALTGVFGYLVAKNIAKDMRIAITGKV